MRKQTIIGMLLAISGFALIIGSLTSWFLAAISGLQFWLGLVVGILCLIVGLGLVAAGLLEAFLHRGSTALVDGFQAG